MDEHEKVQDASTVIPFASVFFMQAFALALAEEHPRLLELTQKHIEAMKRHKLGETYPLSISLIESMLKNTPEAKHHEP